MRDLFQNDFNKHDIIHDIMAESGAYPGPLPAVGP